MNTCTYCDANALYHDRDSGARLCPVHSRLEVSGPRGKAPRPPLTIRPATTADRPRIAELADYFWGEVEVESFGHSYRVDMLPAYVACDEDDIVGLVSYAREGDATNLVMLNVLPQWQGRGAARDLITTVVEITRAQGANRVIVSSTTSQANAYPSERGSLFSDVFWTALGDNQDVWSAYRTAEAAVDARGLMQTPWLDDNGDAVANEEDGDLARGRGLAGVFGGSEPVIDWLMVGEIGAGGTATVAAQVRGDFAVRGVHAEVYPPGYEEPEGGPGETPVVGVPTTTLQLAGGDLYTATLTGLDAPGFYRVVGYAVDDEDNWALPRCALVHSGVAVYLPLVLK